jgi:uncharacterized protein YfaP (DUF2135 family)
MLLLLGQRPGPQTRLTTLRPNSIRHPFLNKLSSNSGFTDYNDNDMKKVKIFTDGCCKGNPGPGGYGCIIMFNGDVKELKGGEQSTTNNIMELTAAIVALVHDDATVDQALAILNG